MTTVIERIIKILIMKKKKKIMIIKMKTSYNNKGNTSSVISK